MPKESSTGLRTVPVIRCAALTPAQKRFNSLIANIGRARETLAAWREGIDLYHTANGEVLEPLRTELRDATRTLAFALEAALAQSGWTKPEKRTLRDLICEVSGSVLANSDGEDDELKALYARHSDTDFDTEQQEMVLAMKSFTESLTGMNLGDDDIKSTEDLVDRLHQGMAQEAQARREEDASHTERKRLTAAQKRRAADEKDATQSVRDIFRKLASALHPDRETDETQRAGKTTLMQRVNQAYAAQDLLALLELQLEIEQIDASHIAGASEQRLKHYNKVLAEQLDQLKQETSAIQAQFRMEFDLFDERSLQPRRLGELVQREKANLRYDLLAAQRDAARLSDAQATRRWLREQMQAMREYARNVPF